MHRNVEIWEKRHERLEAIFLARSRHFMEARTSSDWSAASDANRDAWRARYDALERRIWRALCVAKGWRKA
jgi:hypothetical protein